MLVDNEIELEILAGNIKISNFDKKQLNPNSYNLKLHNKLLVYDEKVLDMKKPNKYHEIIIPEDGIILKPNKLYLGRTEEYTETEKYIPMIEGRSSVGRLGVFVHVTAGFGDIGFKGCWTLEIMCIEPVKIYPGIEICQIFYNQANGICRKLYDGKYANNDDVQPSMMYKDFYK